MTKLQIGRRAILAAAPALIAAPSIVRAQGSKPEKSKVVLAVGGKSADDNKARLERAQANLYETLPLFIGAVLIAHVIGASSALTVWGAALYFWGRVVYVPLYAFGVPYVRSLVWAVSLAGLVMVLASLFFV
mgnify:CR=1 FL=1